MNAAESANVLIRLRGNDDLFRGDFDGAWDFRGLPLPLKLQGEVRFAFWCSISPNLKRSLIMDGSKGAPGTGVCREVLQWSPLRISLDLRSSLCPFY